MEAWKPLHYTKPLTENFESRGDDYIDFAETFLKPLRGGGSGEELSLTEWQKWLLRHIFEEREGGTLRYRRVVVGLPRKNGKSFLASIIQIVNLFNSVQGDELYVAARSSEQASIVFGAAEQMAREVEGIEEYFNFTPSKKIIKNIHTGVEFKALGADGKSAQGYAPYISIADELHAWDTPRGRTMWSSLKDGSGDRTESMLIAISTAGEVYDSILGNLYQQGKALSKMSPEDMTSTAFGFFWWGADEDADPSDREQWKQANPMLAEGLYSWDELEAEWSTVEQTGLNDFIRYHLNLFSGAQGQGDEITWIQSPAHLEALLVHRDDGSLRPGERIVVGFDGSRLHDSTALVGIAVEPDENGKHRTELLGIWEKQLSNPNWKVPRDKVMEKVDDIFEKYQVDLFYADDSEWKDELLTWSEAYGRVVNILPQTHRRMRDAQNAGLYYILEGLLCFPDNADTARLHSHISNAVVKYTGTITKPSKMSRSKIDAAIAFILAMLALTRQKERDKRTQDKPKKARITGIR